MQVNGVWKSTGIAMLIDIFDVFSKTVSQIHFKLGGYVPWVGPYQVCSNGYGPVIFWMFEVNLIDGLGDEVKNIN